MNHPVIKYNAFEDLQLNEQIAADKMARKTLTVHTIINAGKIMSSFIIQQKDKEGHLIYNKSTQDYKQALTWYNDLIRPTSDKE